MEIKIVSGNYNKFLEIKKLLEKYNIEAVWIEYEPQEIQSEYIEEVAVNKAIKSLEIIAPPLLVEDSALCIKALKGFPGPFSSYIFKKIGNDGILKLMLDIEDREAEFISVIALCINVRIIKIFTGKVKGLISKEKRGRFGFGYDPIFIPNGYNKTLAEMSIEDKNLISHRGKAVMKLVNYLKLAGKI